MLILICQESVFNKMAPSFDCVVSSLLCAEENSSVFGDDDDGLVVDYGVLEYEDRLHQRRHQVGNQTYGEEIFTGLLMPSEECLALMIDKEREHLPASDYFKRLKNGDLDLGTRREAVDWIRKVGPLLTRSLFPDPFFCPSMAAFNSFFFL